MDRELIRKELAMYGILVGDDGLVTVLSNGKEVQLEMDQQISKLKSSIAAHKELMKELWRELKTTIHHKPMAMVAGNDWTKRMFTESLKHLNRLLISMRMDRRFIKQHLQRDVNTFSETFMQKVIDYKLSLDWLHHLIMTDRYRISLLKAYRSSGQDAKTVVAIIGPWGGLDLPMQERVWEYKSDEENIEGREKEKQVQQRYKLPDTYNDPYEFEEGFYYRELRNEPYEFGDEDSNPYPHRDLLWDS